jgi:hypothetical protein
VDIRNSRQGKGRGGGALSGALTTAEIDATMAYADAEKAPAVRLCASDSRSFDLARQPCNTRDPVRTYPTSSLPLVRASQRRGSRGAVSSGAGISSRLYRRGPTFTC